MRVLVFGCRGMLGKELLELLGREDFAVTGIDRKTLNLEEQDMIAPVIRENSPDVIVNCAAYTNVDLAEEERELALKVNRDAPGIMATVCQEMSIPLIHVSTDYVFDGNSAAPYRETDETSPINFYGYSKLQGELAVKSVLRQHLIVRTSWLYGRYGKNFVKTILKLSREKDRIEVVSDQYGSPTWARDLAGSLVKILKAVRLDRERIKWGIYHYAGRGETSWYGFACKIIEYAGEYEKFRISGIKPIESSAYKTAAARPKRSVLNCDKIFSCFGIEARLWEFSLEEMIGEYYHDRCR